MLYHNFIHSLFRVQFLVSTSFSSSAYKRSYSLTSNSSAANGSRIILMSTNIDASGDGGGAIAVSQSHQPGKGPDHPSLRGIKFVIFPDNVWGQRWDFIMICAIWYFCFYISFFLGISGGYFSRYSQVW